jgi:hypothetical protein
LGVVSTALAQESQSCEKPCTRLFEEARKLPTPSPESIRRYGNRVQDQGGECLGCGFEKLGLGEESNRNEERDRDLILP